MWADIRDKVATMGPVAEPIAQWVAWVEETGGDPPDKAVDLVLRLTSDAGADTNGRVLLGRGPAPGADPQLGGRAGRASLADGKRRLDRGPIRGRLGRCFGS